MAFIINPYSHGVSVASAYIQATGGHISIDTSTSIKYHLFTYTGSLQYLDVSYVPNDATNRNIALWVIGGGGGGGGQRTGTYIGPGGGGSGGYNATNGMTVNITNSTNGDNFPNGIPISIGAGGVGGGNGDGEYAANGVITEFSTSGLDNQVDHWAANGGGRGAGQAVASGSGYSAGGGASGGGGHTYREAGGYTSTPYGEWGNEGGDHDAGSGYNTCSSSQGAGGGSIYSEGGANDGNNDCTHGPAGLANRSMKMDGTSPVIDGSWVTYDVGYGGYGKGGFSNNAPNSRGGFGNGGDGGVDGADGDPGAVFLYYNWADESGPP